jgi:hypothetical protein
MMTTSHSNDTVSRHREEDLLDDDDDDADFVPEGTLLEITNFLISSNLEGRIENFFTIKISKNNFQSQGKFCRQNRFTFRDSFLII